MKTILLCNAQQADTFRREAGLLEREAIRPSSPATMQGVKLTEGDLILEWPGWRQEQPQAKEIVDSIKVCIARSGNAGPEWVSSNVLTAT